MVVPILQMCKTILSGKDFNRDDFIENGFDVFILQAIEFLTNVKRSSKAAISHVKTQNIDIIIKTLNVILSDIKKSALSRLPHDALSKLFTFLLHPETSEVYRTPCLQIFLNILSRIIDKYEIYQDAIMLLIPFNRFSHASESFDYTYAKYMEILVSGFPKGSRTDAINNIHHVYDWIIMHWAVSSVQLSDVFFKYFVCVIYNDFCRTLKLSKIDMGFAGLPSPDLHTETLRFLHNSVSLDYSLDPIPLFKTTDHMKAIFHILQLSKDFCNCSNVLTSLKIFTLFFNNSYLILHLNDLDHDILLEAPIMVIKLVAWLISRDDLVSGDYKAVYSSFTAIFHSFLSNMDIFKTTKSDPLRERVLKFSQFKNFGNIGDLKSIWFELEQIAELKKIPMFQDPIKKLISEMNIFDKILNNKVVDFESPEVTRLCTTLYNIRRLCHKYLFTDMLKYFDILFRASTHNHCSQVLLTYSYINELISTLNLTQPLWDFVCDIVKINGYTAAATCRYSQLIAILLIPTVLELSTSQEDIKYWCAVHQSRYHPEPEPYDFFLKHYDQMLDTPHEVVMKYLDVEWPPFVDIFNEIKNIPIKDPIIADYTDENFNELADCMIAPFTSFQSEPDISKKHNMYSVIFSFCQTLAKTSVLPSFVPSIRTGAFTYTKRLLFSATLDCKDSLIVEKSFLILGSFINRYETALIMTEELTALWFTAIILMLLNNNEAHRFIGATYATDTIFYGLHGSTCLVPIVLKYITEKTTGFPDDYKIRLDAVFPLLSIKHVLPDIVKRNVLTRIDLQRNCYIKNYQDLFDVRSRDLYTSSINYLYSLSKKMEVFGHYLCVTITPLICHEIMSSNRSSSNMSVIFSIIRKIAQSKNFGAVAIIRSLLHFSDAINEYASDAMLEFISDFAELSMNFYSSLDDDNPDINYLTGLLSITTLLFIYNYKITKDTEIFNSFYDFLYTVSSTDQLESQHNSNLNAVKKPFVLFLRFLATFYGFYPYHYSTLFPSQISSGNNVKNTFYIKSGAVHQIFQDSNEKAIIHSLTQCGHFTWGFKSYTKDFYSGFNFSALNTLNYISASDFHGLNTDQARINVKLDSFIKDLEAMELSLPKPIFDKDYNFDLFNTQVAVEKKNEFENFQAKKVKHDKPSFKNENVRSAIMCSLGLANVLKYRLRETSTNSPEVSKLLELNHRNRFKAAVVYVSLNSTECEDILRTEYKDTPPHFKEFLQGLGCTIDLKTHRGYSGDLDITNKRNGDISIYFSDFMHEIMFQVFPLFSKDSLDPKQGFKKRFISKNPIIIVWNDNIGSNFDTSTLGSHGTKLFIVIQPMNIGLFLVHLYGYDGFLFHKHSKTQYVVRKSSLPTLIRALVIQSSILLISDNAQLDPIFEISNYVDDLARIARADLNTNSLASLLYKSPQNNV